MLALSLLIFTNYKGKNIIIATGTGKNFGKKIAGEKNFLGMGVF